MAASQHAFSMGHWALLCLGTDRHKLLHATCWLGLRKNLLDASVPAAQKKFREKGFQMCMKYPILKVLYVHGKQQVTTRCT